jgi:hypothetical protein
MMTFGLGLYAVFVLLGVTTDRTDLILAAAVASWQILLAVAGGWRPWPRTKEENP